MEILFEIRYNKRTELQLYVQKRIGSEHYLPLMSDQYLSWIKEKDMKAWEKAQQIFREARPVVRSEEEQTWTDNVDVSQFYDDNLSLDWGSNVPGSGAPEKIMVAAVQAL